MTPIQAAMTVAVAALVTIGLRFLPFLIFNKRETPAYIVWLGNVLPYAIMGMLVVFCLKDVQIMSGSHGIPELIASIAVVLLHIWKRNSLISIVGGTAIYMVLIQIVFA